MKQRETGRSKTVRTDEFPNAATLPDEVAGMREGTRPVARTPAKSDAPRATDGPTPQPPLGGERADNGND